MSNLKKFNTEADYSAATLNYPAVSWVTSTDTLHYDKKAPVVNDKLMFVTNGDGEGESSMVLYNCGSSGVEGNITGITINGADVNPTSCTSLDQYDASQVYAVKFYIDDELTSVDDWFTGDLGLAAASTPATIDVLYPAWITRIDSNIQSNTKNLICLATTPPSVEALESTISYDAAIYVPDSVVNAYKEDDYWGEMRDNIYPLSEYSGNIQL